MSLTSQRPTTGHHRNERAAAALAADVAAFCARRLARVAGTHGLLVAGPRLPAPAVAGVACWTVLRPSAPGASARWTGALRAEPLRLPFADDSFCAALVAFAGAIDLDVAREFARVLAPYGTLLVADVHPGSLWPGGTAPWHCERTLRAAGLDVVPAVRCGAPWPRSRGAAGLPRWLVSGLGGAWVVGARRSVLAALPLRKAVGRRVIDQGALLPGARRQCA